MLSALLTLIILSTSALASSGNGPIIVGGGGEGEYSVIFAHANLRELSEDCARTSCGFDSTEFARFMRLKPFVQAPLRPLLKTAADLGKNLFVIRGPDVWINKDLLWIDTEKTKAYDLAEAFVLWLKILRAKAGLEPRDFRSIEDKARVAFKSESFRGQITSADRQTFEFLLWRNASGNDRLAARDPSLSSLDLSREVASHLKCGADSLLKFFSPTWTPAPDDSGGGDKILLALNFGVKWSCGASGKGNSFGRAVMSAKRAPGGAFVFDPSSLFIHVDTGSFQ